MQKKVVKTKSLENQNKILSLKRRVASLEKGIEDQIKSDVTPAIVASFGFIIALVWRDAIREGLGYFLRQAGLVEESSVVLYNFISAVLVTIVVIAIMMGVSKYGRSRKKDESSEK